MMLKMASLFSGIGGFELPAVSRKWEIVFQVENDPFALAILNHYHPNSKKYEGIKECTGAEYRGAIDIMAGGDPCQPASVAGKMEAMEDTRFLWPEMYRLIRVIRPSIVVNENVPGTIPTGILDRKIDQLEDQGYTCWPPLLIPAKTIGQCHYRERVFLVAYTSPQGWSDRLRGYTKNNSLSKKFGPTLDVSRSAFLQFTESVGQPALFGMDDGFPHRIHQLATLGNAVQVEVVNHLYTAIEDFIIHMNKDSISNQAMACRSEL